MKSCNLHVNRNKLFVKGNRNVKKPNYPKPHYPQGQQYFNDLEPGLGFIKYQLCKKRVHFQSLRIIQFR